MYDVPYFTYRHFINRAGTLKKKRITTGKYYHFIPTLFLPTAHISRGDG